MELLDEVKDAVLPASSNRCLLPPPSAHPSPTPLPSPPTTIASGRMGTRYFPSSLRAPPLALMLTHAKVTRGGRVEAGLLMVVRLVSRVDGSVTMFSFRHSVDSVIPPLSASASTRYVIWEKSSLFFPLGLNRNRTICLPMSVTFLPTILIWPFVMGGQKSTRVPEKIITRRDSNLTAVPNGEKVPLKVPLKSPTSRKVHQCPLFVAVNTTKSGTIFVFAQE